MKQAFLLLVCALLVAVAAQYPQVIEELLPKDPMSKKFCTIDHKANLARLLTIAEDLDDLVSTLKKELRCEKPGGPMNPLTCCKDLPPESISGEYWIKPECGLDPFKGYCDTKPRCNSTGGWLKVADLDMTDPEQSCPAGFRLISRTTAPMRTCGRSESIQDGCSSVTFPVHGIEYSKVCGRVKAYQVASPDGFFKYSSYNINLERAYVDGVSVTHGNPRSHIWTFACSWTNSNSRSNGCPCVNGNNRVSVPSFVGQDYFCETGHRNEWGWEEFYPDNPLWDGKGCDETTSCCDDQPWFCRDLPSPTTEDIEVRLCGDQQVADEDTPIEAIELYIN